MTTKLDAVTVTLNPAIDETIFVDRLAPGTVHRALSFHRQPGGKGINVAAMLARAGLEVLATGLLGRDGAEFFERFFAARGPAG
jgi:1-phosphofructokinase